ncbi:hypothetical protein ACWDSD_33425 [Streptomyces spiralis]
MPARRTVSGSSCAQDLNGRYDTDGVSTADAKQQGNLGGKGWSFPADQLPTPGLASVGGHDYRIPETSGTAGNFLGLRGQRTNLTPGRYSALDLLVTAVNGDQHADVTVRYSDGTTSTVPLDVTDWAATTPHFGEDTALTATTRYNVNGAADGRTVRIWHVALPVDPERTAASVSSTAVSNVKVFALSGRA